MFMNERKGQQKSIMSTFMISNLIAQTKSKQKLIMFTSESTSSLTTRKDDRDQSYCFRISNLIDQTKYSDTVLHGIAGLHEMARQGIKGMI
jgi:hypothetical protein